MEPLNCETKTLQASCDESGDISVSLDIKIQTSEDHQQSDNKKECSAPSDKTEKNRRKDRPKNILCAIGVIGVIVWILSYPVCLWFDIPYPFIQEIQLAIDLIPALSYAISFVAITALFAKMGLTHKKWGLNWLYVLFFIDTFIFYFVILCYGEYTGQNVTNLAKGLFAIMAILLMGGLWYVFEKNGFTKNFVAGFTLWCSAGSLIMLTLGSQENVLYAAINATLIISSIAGALPFVFEKLKENSSQSETKNIETEGE